MVELNLELFVPQQIQPRPRLKKQNEIEPNVQEHHFIDLMQNRHPNLTIVMH